MSSVAESVGSVSGDGQESNLSTVDEEILKITMKRRTFRVVLHLTSSDSNQLGDINVAVEDHDFRGDHKKLFLIRVSRERIPNPNNIENAFVEMPNHFEVYVSGDEDATHFIGAINNVRNE